MRDVRRSKNSTGIVIPVMQAMAEPMMLVDKGAEWLDRNYKG